MSSGETHDPVLKELRCACGFLCGYGETLVEIECIYCWSERDFLERELAALGEDEKRASRPAIYNGEKDQTPWRRGLMHDRKQSMRWAFDDIRYWKDAEDE